MTIYRKTDLHGLIIVYPVMITKFNNCLLLSTISIPHLGGCCFHPVLTWFYKVTLRLTSTHTDTGSYFIPACISHMLVLIVDPTTHHPYWITGTWWVSLMKHLSLLASSVLVCPHVLFYLAGPTSEHVRTGCSRSHLRCPCTKFRVNGTSTITRICQTGHYCYHKHSEV